MLPSELTNTIEHFIVYVHRNEAHFTCIYVYYNNVFEADNIYKNPPTNVISPIFFDTFILLWGSTHDSAECWNAHRSPAARDSFKRVYDLCTAGWRRPSGPPNKNPGYAGGTYNLRAEAFYLSSTVHLTISPE